MTRLALATLLAALAIVTGSWGIPTSVAADEALVMEIIPLRHRLVDDVVPTLRQLVAPGGTVTGMNNQLIIRTTPANMADLQQVLAALDQRLRNLRISVRQDVQAHHELREDEFSARVQGGDVGVSVGAGGVSDGPGARVSAGGRDLSVDLRNFSTRAREDEGTAHFVTTIEGQPAWIQTGESVPVGQVAIYPTPFGLNRVDSVAYEDVGSGFMVTPRVVGDDGVNLEVSPYRDKFVPGGGGVIDSRGLNTVVTGRLGQWIALGGADRSANDQERGIGYRTRRNAADLYDVWIKVEVVP